MSYRDRRSPDRGRERYEPPTPIDSYIPPTSSRAPRPRSRSPTGYRRRSRTPPRPAPDSWRGRPASPPRRYDPRIDSYSSRDSRPRSPRREYAPADSRYENVSRAARERSPPPLKRERDSSPYGRVGRSPPPAKRERIGSPAREYGRPRSPPRRTYSPPHDSKPSYRPRSRSPRRDERVDPYAAKTWRRQSPSPRVDSGRDSVATSRRSSPRPFNRRPTEATASEDLRSAPPSSYRSPVRRDPPSARARSPYREETNVSRSRQSPSRDFPENEPRYAQRDGPATTGTDYRERAPPSGPASSYRDGTSSAISPPTGPSNASVSMSAHNRAGPPSAPSYPRGGYGAYRGRGGPGAARDYPPPRRGQSSWGPGASYAGAGTSRDPYPPHDPAAPYESRTPLSRRESGYAGSAGYGGMPFRGSSNSTSMTYPRTQRFNQAVSGIPEIKPGGEKLPPIHDRTKADKLEEEAARLRKLIDDKEMKKRQGLKEFEKLEKESANASLISELAEDHLRSLNGEGEGMAAAF